MGLLAAQPGELTHLSATLKDAFEHTAYSVSLKLLAFWETSLKMVSVSAYFLLGSFVQAKIFGT